MRIYEPIRVDGQLRCGGPCRRVAELETALGARLFRRSTRQIALTEAGRTFYATCERLLGDLKDAEYALLGEYRTPDGGPHGHGPDGIRPDASAAGGARVSGCLPAVDFLPLLGLTAAAVAESKGIPTELRRLPHESLRRVPASPRPVSPCACAHGQRLPLDRLTSAVRAPEC